MAKITSIQSVPPEAGALIPAIENLAVRRCVEAYDRAQQTARENGKGNVVSAIEGAKAYCKTLPPLSGHQNICDFIACVAYGMLIEAIIGTDGARLLYAAQVAYATVRRPAASPKSTAA